MDKTKQVVYDGFRAGKRIIFFLLKKNFNKQLRKESVMYRKMGVGGLSIPAWIEKSTAEEFLETNIVTKAEWQVVGISGGEFRSFLESELSSAEREALILDFI